MRILNSVAFFLSMVSQSRSTRGKQVKEILEEHLGKERASSFPVLAERFSLSELPNVHNAIQDFFKAPGRTQQTHGVPLDSHQEPGLAQFITPQKYHESPIVGPVSYASVQLADDVKMACIQSALFLIRDRGTPIAVYQSCSKRSYDAHLTVEVMAENREQCEAFLAEIRNSMRAKNVYRGRMISLSRESSDIRVQFHKLEPVSRESVILPEEVLTRVERQTFAFTQHREAMLKGGRHLKRGLLLHGPPGTGKTHTARYVASRMPDRTTLLVTGRQQALIGPCCAMARLLQPSTILLEDIDLIAEDRSSERSCAPLLFDLLNEMDGLREDADVLFILTTNRPESLEPALAARPGRVDMAVEIPLPDADCRERLIQVYSQGLRLALSEPGWLIARTEGVSAAFIKELLRHSALIAADRQSPEQITDEHVREALRELLSDRDTLTRSLLGASQARQGAA